MDFLADNIVWIAMIVLYPVWVRISKRICESLHRHIDKKRLVKIRYSHNGKLIGEKTVILDVTDPVFDQIKKAKQKD